MKLTDFKVLTFDCYGTLIDWETGILKALNQSVNKLTKSFSNEQILETFSRHEHAQETETPSMIYSQLLAAVHQRMAKEWGIAVTEGEGAKFGASVADWPAFPDSPAALRYLKRHYRLVILSNVDHDSFRGSNKRLGVEFDQVYTAQDIGSYKPDNRNFRYLLSHLGALGYGKQDILHTAQSLFHDHIPAKRFGLASAWIDRRHDKEGFGATVRPEVMPHYDFRFTGLAEMVAAHKKEIEEAAA